METSAIREQIEGVRGNPVYDRRGTRIGYLEEVFYDNESRVPAWLGVATGFLGTRLVVVPVGGTTPLGDGVRVGYARELVMTAPDLCDEELDRATERELLAHYGLARALSPTGVAGIPGYERGRIM